MPLYEAVVLGILQGLTEFLPISSSGHLVVIRWVLGWDDPGLTFDVGLHMGTLAAVAYVFWRDLLGMARAAISEGLGTWEGRLGWGIALGTVPAAVAGYFFDELAETVLRHPLIVAGALAVIGLVLWAADRWGRKRKDVQGLALTDLLLIGLAQCLALIPGVSRSGITMAAGLARGLRRETAARVSFLLSFPIILGAGVLKLRHLQPGDAGPSFWLGVLVSAVVGTLVIRFLLDFLRRGTFLVFAVYRLALAALILVLYVQM